MINGRMNVHIQATLILMRMIFFIHFKLEEEEEGPGGYKLQPIWWWCIMNLLAQVPIFFKCLRQQMIACVIMRNSDD